MNQSKGDNSYSQNIYILIYSSNLNSILFIPKDALPCGGAAALLLFPATEKYQPPSQHICIYTVFLSSELPLLPCCDAAGNENRMGEGSEWYISFCRGGGWDGELSNGRERVEETERERDREGGVKSTRLLLYGKHGVWLTVQMDALCSVERPTFKVFELVEPCSVIKPFYLTVLPNF